MAHEWSCEHCGRPTEAAERACDDCGAGMCEQCTDLHDDQAACPLTLLQQFHEAAPCPTSSSSS